MTAPAETALEDLGIAYRRLDFPDGILYFCRGKDAAFNLVLTPGGGVHLWRFARTGLPSGGAGLRREYPAGRGVVGFEVTGEDDLNIFSRGSLAEARPEDRLGLLRRQVADFLDLSARVRA